MNIAYIDLNYEDHFEDFSDLPIKYGGARVVPSALLYNNPNFHIYANSKCFSNIKDLEILKRCHVLDWPSREKIRSGAYVKDVIPESDNYDIFFTTATDIKLNLTHCRSKKSVIWSIGMQEGINPENKHLVCFSYQYQHPRLQHNNHIIHHAVIGPKVPNYQEYKKEDMIFQCTRHNKLFSSIEMAGLAIKNGVKTVFGGPIENGYDLLSYIDNKTTFYLGEVDYQTKVEYYKKSKFVSSLNTYPTCATLSAKEAMSYGCAVLATPVGEWPYYVLEGFNGFIVNDERSFLNAWSQRDSIKQINCWNTAYQHREEKMVSEFNGIFENIVNNNL